MKAIEKFLSKSIDPSGTNPDQKTRQPCNINIKKSMYFISPHYTSFGQTYSHIYFQRTTRLKKSCEMYINSQLNLDKTKYTIHKNIISLSSNIQHQILIGTLYKNMKLRPSMIKQYSENILQKPNFEITTNFCSENDTLALDDMNGRTSLTVVPNQESTVPGLQFDPKYFSSGVVIALECTLDESGKVFAHRCFPPMLPPQIKWPATSNSKPPKYIAIVSGLKLGDENQRDLIQLDLLLEYLTGGNTLSHSNNIASCVLLGNILSITEQDPILKKKRSINPNSSSFSQLASQIDSMDLAQQSQYFDRFLTRLGASLPVYCVPGQTDPTSASLPQPPMRLRILAPNAFRRFGTLAQDESNLSISCLTNPSSFLVDESLSFLVHSGQPIDNLAHFTKYNSAIERLEATLRWGHIAPTCPDGLSCFPFVKKDPFILTETPHVFIAGNQTVFQHKSVKVPTPQGLSNVELICAPCFRSTGNIILVDTQTGHPRVVSFRGYDDIKKIDPTDI